MFDLGRYDMFLFRFVEACDSFDTHVVTFCCTGGEDYTADVGADDVCDVAACLFDCFFGFPAVGVGATVGISVEVC